MFVMFVPSSTALTAFQPQKTPGEARVMEYVKYGNTPSLPLCLAHNILQSISFGLLQNSYSSLTPSCQHAGVNLMALE